MKKTLVCLIILFAGYQAVAQNTPVDPKGTPTTNKDLPSNNPALGSNSGVNPAGSPGTITGHSGNSNSVNNQTVPNPNIEPGVFLSSSPGGTVYTTPAPAGSNVPASTTAVTNNGGAVIVPEAKPKPIEEVAIEAPKVPAPNPPIATRSSVPPTAPVANPGMKRKIKKESSASKTTTTKTNVVKEKALPAYSPLLSNYISKEVIEKIKTKYGAAVYDIKTVRVVKTNKLAYLVRLSENGSFRNELYYDEQ